MFNTKCDLSVKGNGSVLFKIWKKLTKSAYQENFHIDIKKKKKTCMTITHKCICMTISQKMQ